MIVTTWRTITIEGAKSALKLYNAGMYGCLKNPDLDQQALRWSVLRSGIFLQRIINCERRCLPTSGKIPEMPQRKQGPICEEHTNHSAAPLTVWFEKEAFRIHNGDSRGCGVCYESFAQSAS